MQSINNLLSQVRIISNKNTEILDATGGRFNMFRVCGVNHYENTHSAILAELLNPNGTHGLKSKLLECFIETLGDYFTIEKFDFEKSRIHTEHSTEEGRIDILIEYNQNNSIIIENKIYANDQPEQLKRYNRYAQKYKNGYQILYLTLFGQEASKQSSDGVHYLTISYKEHVINWLEKCVAIASRFPIVRETIIQYINHLKQLTNQDMDENNKKEIIEVLSKIENLRAAKVIQQNYSSTFDSIIEKHFNPKMEEFAKQNGLDYKYEKSEEFYVRFHLKNSIWKNKCCIGFTFEGGSCLYGIKYNNLNDCVSEEGRKTLHENLNKLGISGKKSNWWPFYTHFPNLSLDTWESEIITNDNFFQTCTERIKNLIDAMKNVTL